MDRGSILFVYNPRSGMQTGMTVGKKLNDIMNLCTAAGYDVICHPTQTRGDCLETVKRLGNTVDRVIVAGGDGTLNEAVNGFLSAGITSPFGYIPCGSTTDFSHSVGIPVQIMKAARTALEGVPFAYDAGLMNDRWFTYVAGFGAFTDVTYTTPRETKNALGYFAYLISGAASLPNITPVHIRYESQEKIGDGDYILGLISNTLQVAGMKNILPRDISLDDGLLEVLLVKNPRNPIELNKILTSVMKRDFGADCFDYFKTAEISLSCDEPLSWTLDGENGGAHTKTRITCHKQALKIITAGK